MVRGFVSGLVWGGLVASAGLAVISQIAPLPPSANIPAAPSATAEEAPAPDLAARPEDATPDAAEGAAAEAMPDATAEPSAPVAETPVTPEPEPETPSAGPGDAASAPPAPASVDPAPPAAPDAPDPAGAPPPAVVAADAAPEAPAASSPGRPEAAADPVPGRVDPPPPPPLDDALLAPATDAADAPPTTAAPQPAPAAGGATEPARDPLPQVDADPAPPSGDGASPPDMVDAPGADAPGAAAPEADGSDAAPPALPGRAADILPEADPSVATDRLPRIGDAEPLPEVEVLPEDTAPPRPIEAFARPFDNPAGKPLFAILLADDGSAGLDREMLAALPFPVTFVVDPLRPGAAEAAAIYRAGMQEVVFAASGLPQGATAVDVEQTFQAHALALPETVGVIDLPQGGFQDNRTLAAAVLPILAEQGRGLLTFDRGLNAADQIARREGVPSATVFRRLDAEGESIPTMRRYLDRAAFRAAQEGEVVVIGSTRPETIAALLEWTVEGRAASVAIAPVSAVLSRP